MGHAASSGRNAHEPTRVGLPERRPCCGGVVGDPLDEGAKPPLPPPNPLPPPLLGGNTDIVLKNLAGLDDAAIAGLRRDGVI